MPLILVKKSVDPLTAATSGNINEESKGEIDFNQMRCPMENQFSIENQRPLTTTLEDDIMGQATYLQFANKSRDINSLIREVQEER